jgi:hypothetical protein
MGVHTVTLKIEGPSGDDGNVRLKDFVGRVQALNGFLQKADLDLSRDQSLTDFRIENLSRSSPATVTVGLYPIDEKNDQTSELSKYINDVFLALENGGADENLDVAVVEQVQSLIAPVGKRLGYMALAIDEKNYQIDNDFAYHVSELLRVHEECFGTVEGALEQINIHRDANVFSIYPEVGPNKIKCKFPKRLAEEAKSAVGFYVEVSGVLRFRHNANFPHEIDVQEIEVYPPSRELPDFYDLRGIAPHATGSLSSEDFVAKLRNEWEH